MNKKILVACLIGLVLLSLGCLNQKPILIEQNVSIASDVNYQLINDVNNANFLNGIPGSGYIRTDGTSTTTSTIPFSAGSTKGLSLTGLKEFCSTIPGDVSCEFTLEAGKTRLKLPRIQMQDSFSIGENYLHIGIADLGSKIYYDNSTIPELVIASEDLLVPTSGMRITGMRLGVLDINMSVIPRERSDTNIGSDSNRWNKGFFGNLTITNDVNANRFCLNGVDKNCWTNGKLLTSNASFHVKMPAGSILAFNTLNTGSAITSTSGLKALQVSGTTVSWNTSTGIGNSVFATSPIITTPTIYGTDGAAIFNLWSGSNPVQKTYINRVQTTNATQTTIQTLTPMTNGVTMYEAKVVGENTSLDTEAVATVVRAAYTNTAGTPTLIGSVTVDYLAQSAVYTATFTVSGSNVLLRVTGLVGDNVRWVSNVTTYSAETSV
jgi:hypothetical protein